MPKKISVVINTLNEEKNIARVIESVKWADEIVVCDMYSDDKTAVIAKKLGANVVLHKKEEYVELARNFAISRAEGEWILVLDPDEEVGDELRERILQIASKVQQIVYVRIPRKNLIFGKWMKTSMWWPDLNVRFFKKGKVKWGDQIHRPPEVSGQGLDLPADEKYAIVHHNYENVSGFIKRMDRYTGVQASELKKAGYKINWKDLFDKPLSEFLSRFFAGGGYKDGLHGLALSLLQAFSFAVVYLKVWEMDKFLGQDIDLKELEGQKDKSAEAIDYWFKQVKHPVNFLKRFFGRN